MWVIHPDRYRPGGQDFGRGASVNLQDRTPLVSASLFAALLEKFSYQRRPTGLMTGAYARTVVAMKAFVEQDQIAPVWIVGIDQIRPVHRAFALWCLHENA